MKIYCPTCGLFVAEIITGSNIRKGSVFICKECYERFKIADTLAKLSKEQTKNNMPDFFTNLFNK